MESLVILLDGRECGRLSVREQGLYLHCRAVCDLARDTEPMRLVVVGEQGEWPLGIPQPEGGRFVLGRQISIREACRAGRLLRGELRPVERREGEWRPASPDALFREERLRRQLRNVQGILYCRGREGQSVAVPFDTEKPFPLTELFCFARICRIGGREYAVFRFDRENRPSFT